MNYCSRRHQKKEWPTHKQVCKMRHMREQIGELTDNHRKLFAPPPHRRCISLCASSSTSLAMPPPRNALLKFAPPKLFACVSVVLMITSIQIHKTVLPARHKVTCNYFLLSSEKRGTQELREPERQNLSGSQIILRSAVDKTATLHLSQAQQAGKDATQRRGKQCSNRFSVFHVCGGNATPKFLAGFRRYQKASHESAD